MDIYPVTHWSSFGNCSGKQYRSMTMDYLHLRNMVFWRESKSKIMSQSRVRDHLEFILSKVKFWDVGKQSHKHMFYLNNGITSLCYSRK